MATILEEETTFALTVALPEGLNAGPYMRGAHGPVSIRFHSSELGREEFLEALHDFASKLIRS